MYTWRIEAPAVEGYSCRQVGIGPSWPTFNIILHPLMVKGIITACLSLPSLCAGWTCSLQQQYMIPDK